MPACAGLRPACGGGRAEGHRVRGHPRHCRPEPRRLRHHPGVHGVHDLTRDGERADTRRGRGGLQGARL